MQGCIWNSSLWAGGCPLLQQTQLLDLGNAPCWHPMQDTVCLCAVWAHQWCAQRLWKELPGQKDKEHFIPNMYEIVVLLLFCFFFFVQILELICIDSVLETLFQCLRDVINIWQRFCILSFSSSIYPNMQSCLCSQGVVTVGFVTIFLCIVLIIAEIL